VPADKARKITVDATLDVAALLGPNGRLATGDPKHVPVGIYAQQALRKLGLWDTLQPRLASTADVRAALLLVERGEAPAGIVYATDAAVAKGVMIAGVFPDESHDPISYPFAVTKAGDTAEARAFMAFLAGPEARSVFVQRGFKLR
jgi:molybdate transport system substrate-binding protein